MSSLLKPSLNWLLVFVPAAVITHYAAPDAHTTVFVLACISVIPLAGWMGKSTEHLAEKILRDSWSQGPAGADSRSRNNTAAGSGAQVLRNRRESVLGDRVDDRNDRKTHHEADDQRVALHEGVDVAAPRIEAQAVEQ